MYCTKIKKIFFFPIFLFSAFFLFFSCDSASCSSGGKKVENSDYTIEFDANNGSGSMGNQTVVRGNSLTLNACSFTKSGYRFIGWSENSNATVATYTNSQTITPTKNMKLYALWSSAVQANYTVVHSLQQVAGSSLYIEQERTTKTGYVGDLTQATANTYAGYTVQPIQQAIILAGGGTTVNVHYNVNQ
ncbi:MAG: InlB B-repeat-containing protein [Treponema sp.]|nr:InlB B-repeat-containing protein [Treponema sp.]